MNKVFLVQSVAACVFKKLSKAGIKLNDLDCFTPVTTYYGCKSKSDAVKDCRKYNRTETDSRFFVTVVPFY